MEGRERVPRDRGAGRARSGERRRRHRAGDVQAPERRGGRHAQPPRRRPRGVRSPGRRRHRVRGRCGDAERAGALRGARLPRDRDDPGPGRLRRGSRRAQRGDRGGAGRAGQRAHRPRGRQVARAGRRQGPGAARGLLRELRRQVHLDRGLHVRQPRHGEPLRRSDPDRGVAGRRRERDGQRHAAGVRRRPQVPVPHGSVPGHRPARVGARGERQRRRRHARRQGLGQQGRQGLPGDVPEGLQHALCRPAGGLSADHRPRGGVPEHRPGLRPAEQDDRLPAPSAGDRRHRDALHRLDLVEPDDDRRPRRRQPGAGGRARPRSPTGRTAATTSPPSWSSPAPRSRSASRSPARRSR